MDDNRTYSDLNQTLLNVTGSDTDDSFESFTRALYVYGIPVICSFGLLGNVICFKVFVFTMLNNQSSSTYIAALSVSDAGFLFSLLLSWFSNGRIGLHFGHHPAWCHFMIYVTYVCSFLSVWYVVLIMVDRYIVVCHSLRVPEYCTKRKARIATAIVTATGLIIYAHTFYTAVVTGDNCAIQMRAFMLHFIAIFIYTDTAITFIIPFAIVIILNAIVIFSIRRFRSRHDSVNHYGKRDLARFKSVLSLAQFRITRTFSLVSIAMLITNVPSHGIRFYIIVNNLMPQQNSFLVYAQQVFQVLYYFNFAINFLLYSVSSERFRKYASYKYQCYFLYRRQALRNNDHLYR